MGADPTTEKEIIIVFNEAELLLPGETKIGQFQVAVARYTSAGWVSTVPPLDVVVTNYRLILHPQTRRPHPPASIPNTYITKVTEIELGQRSAVYISLKTGHQLFFFISWSQGNQLAETIKTMLTSPIGNEFKHHPAERDINRLIHFIQAL
jgi:hypothetical protein